MSANETDPSDVILTLRHVPDPKRKTWVAFIHGRSRKWGLDREFVGALGGRPRFEEGEVEATADYLLEQGAVYEVCEMGKRRFVIVELKTGRVVDIGRDFVLAFARHREESRDQAREAERRRAEEERRRAAGDIDQAIVRFNAEGGFTPSEN